MNRGSLHTRSFRRTHFFVFRYRWNKNDFTCQKSFRSFQETGPRTWCGQRLFNKSFQLLGGDGGVGGELSKMILERCCRSLELNQALTLFHNPFVDWIRSYCNETTDDLDRLKTFRSAHSTMVSSWILFCHPCLCFAPLHKHRQYKVRGSDG